MTDFGGRLDNWKDPGDLFDEPDLCPECEEGEIEGDKWEWWCSKECGYHGDNID